MFRNIGEKDRESSIDDQEENEILQLSLSIRHNILLADDDSNDGEVVIMEPDFDVLSIDPTDEVMSMIFQNLVLGLDIVDDVQIKGTVIENTFIFTTDLDAIEIDEVKEDMVGVDYVRDETPDELIYMVDQMGESL
jgi:hypothetical protein